MSKITLNTEDIPTLSEVSETVGIPVDELIKNLDEGLSDNQTVKNALSLVKLNKKLNKITGGDIID